MYQNDISELPVLANERLENIFNVYENKDKKYFYNIIQSIQFPQNLPAALFDTYIVQYGDTWPTISYKAYESIHLWWVIAYANNIINPITELTHNRLLKIPKPRLVEEILLQVLTSK